MQNNRQRVTEEFLEELKTKGVLYSVISGIDINTKEVGRDLDLFVPDDENAKEIVDIAANVFARNEFRVCVPPRIWGRRCIGINAEFEYLEVHIVTSFKAMLVPYSVIEPCRPAYLKNTACIDINYYFLKRIMIKYNRYFLFGRAVPTHVVEEADIILSSDLSQNMAPWVFDFLSILTEKGTRNVKRRLQLRALAFLAKSLRFPFATIQFFMRHLWTRTVQVYFSPCAPFYRPVGGGDLSAKQLELLRAEFEKRLGHIFPRTVVLETRSGNFLAVRKHAARQCLVIVLPSWPDRALPGDRAVLLDIDLPIDQLCHVVVDGFVDFNNKRRASNVD